LIAELLDSRQPKTEREHAAVREIERLRHDIERHIAMASELATENEALRAELAACQQDAERYRWVLEHWDTGGPDFGKIMFSSTAETLSADIDTARKGEGKK